MIDISYKSNVAVELEQTANDAFAQAHYFMGKHSCNRIHKFSSN